MKRNYVWLGLGIAALSAILPVDGAPAAARLLEKGITIAQSFNQPKITLQLVAKQKQVQKTAQGQEQVAWNEIQPDTTVQQGAVLRFQVRGKNEGDRPAEKLAVIQPVPKGTVYAIGSATQNNAEVSYSIDGGKTFMAAPMIQVTLPNGKTEMQPAPAEAYSHVRWTFRGAIAPQSGLEVAYEVSVR